MPYRAGVFAMPNEHCFGLSFVLKCWEMYILRGENVQNPTLRSEFGEEKFVDEWCWRSIRMPEGNSDRHIRLSYDTLVRSSPKS